MELNVSKGQWFPGLVSRTVASREKGQLPSTVLIRPHPEYTNSTHKYKRYNKELRQISAEGFKIDWGLEHQTCKERLKEQVKFLPGKQMA